MEKKIYLDNLLFCCNPNSFLKIDEISPHAFDFYFPA